MNTNATSIRIKVHRTQIAWAELQSLQGGPHSASLEDEPDSGIRDETFRGQQRIRKEVEVVLLLSPILVLRVKIWRCKSKSASRSGSSAADGARFRAMQ